MFRFAQTSDAVAATTKKTEKILLVSSLLQSLPIEDAVLAAVFLTGSPFPRWDERVLGAGGRLLARLIGELAAQGKAVLFVSSYLPELLGVCDQLAVMARGRLRDIRPASDWTEETIMAAAVAGGL